MSQANLLRASTLQPGSGKSLNNNRGSTDILKNKNKNATKKLKQKTCSQEVTGIDLFSWLDMDFTHGTGTYMSTLPLVPSKNISQVK